MVIVRDLAAGPLRLDVLRHWLPGVSAGALESRLVRMAEAGLLVRRRYRALPPRVDLELTARGHALAGVIAELARWELGTQWSRPREDEWIDVAAFFRLAPLLRPPDGATPQPDGELALMVVDPAGEEDAEHYAFVREAGRAKLEHRPAPDADARLSGTQDAWVQALSPDGAGSDALAVAGERDLATSFLALFAAGGQGAGAGP